MTSGLLMASLLTDGNRMSLLLCTTDSAVADPIVFCFEGQISSW